MLSGQFAHERALANGWKTYEPDTSHAGPGDIETSCQRLEPCFRFKPWCSLQPPPPPLDCGVRSSRFNLASLAFN